MQIRAELGTKGSLTSLFVNVNVVYSKTNTVAKIVVTIIGWITIKLLYH